MKKVSAPKGMKDILPLEMRNKILMLQKALDVYLKWGFNPIESPIMENIERLKSSDGGDNLALIFEVLKRGLTEEKTKDKTPDQLVDLGLRYDLTAPLARFYASNQGQLPKVAKLLQFGPVFRAERPQKGRYRQFLQFDVDIIGSNDVSCEKQLLLAGSEALKAIGFEDFVIRINDRAILKNLLYDSGFTEAEHPAVLVMIDKLDKVGFEGVQKELLEKEYTSSSVDSLINKLQAAVSGDLSFDKKLDALGIGPETAVRRNMESLFEACNDLDYCTLELDPTLVRGQGYYTGMIFEVMYQDYGFSIAGGGRYDGMIGKQYLGRDVPACGFSLGVERLLLIMQEQSKQVSTIDKKLLLLTTGDLFNEAIELSNQLRQEGWQVDLEIKAKNTKNQIEQHKQVGCSHCALLLDSGLQLGQLEIKAID